MNKFLQKYLQRRTSSGKFIKEIDGLRFFAIAPVLINHLAERVHRQLELNESVSPKDELFFQLIPTGKLGVEIFFVISGFVIAMPLVNRWISSSSTQFDFKKYFIRRLTRLEPPYLIVLLLSFLILTFFGSSLGSVASGTGSYARSSVTLFESLIASIFYLHGLIYQVYPRINPPAWSLEIEFQFYVAAPFILLGIFWFLKKINWEKGFIVTLFTLLILMKVAVVFVFSRKLQMFLVTEYIHFFVLGFVICYLYLKRSFESIYFQKFASAHFIGGMLIFLLCDYYLKPYLLNILFFPRDEYLTIIGLGTLKYAGLFLFFSGVMSGGIGKRISQVTFISTIGGMCYSIYLIHLFVLQAGVSFYFNVAAINLGSFLSNMILLTLLFIPVILIGSALFFILIEKPCMDPKWPSKFKNFLGS